MNIYVGNLPRDTSEDKVRNLFEPFGTVADVKLIKDHDTGEIRGFAFIQMPDKTEANAAIKGLDGSELDGQQLAVNEARPRQDRPGGGSQGGGGRHSGPRTRSW